MRWFQTKRDETWVGYKEVFYSEGSEALAEASQRGCGCPVHEDAHGEAGEGSEQPDGLARLIGVGINGF